MTINHRQSDESPLNDGRSGNSVDTDNRIVSYHNSVFSDLVSAVETAGLSNGIYTPDPYGCAPMAGTLAFQFDTPIGSLDTDLEIQVYEEGNGEDTLITYTVSIDNRETNRTYVIPIVGLLPDGARNKILVSDLTGTDSPFEATVIGPDLPEVITDDLPHETDDGSPSARDGFVEVRVTDDYVEGSNSGELSPGLFFLSVQRDRGLIAFDEKGRIRWYLTTYVTTTSGDVYDGPDEALPHYAFERLANGNFVSGRGSLVAMEYEITGRVRKVVNLAEIAHHNFFPVPISSSETPDDQLLLVPSGTTETEPYEIDGLVANRDCVALMRWSDAEEIQYWNYRAIIDPTREAFPKDYSLEGYYDWAHLNHCVYATNPNVVLTSIRHQGLVCLRATIWPVQPNIEFIVGSREDWPEELQEYLVTPVDEFGGAPLFEFDENGANAEADRSFWVWGQHSIIEAASNATSGSNFVDFWVLNNGNYRARTDQHDPALYARENYSSAVKFSVKLSTREIKKVAEYNAADDNLQTPIAETYSPFVGNIEQINETNCLINFGGAIIEKGTNYMLSRDNIGAADPIDPLITTTTPYHGKIILHEFNEELMENGPIVGFEIDPVGYEINDDPDLSLSPNDRTNCYSYRAHKFPICPENYVVESVPVSAKK